MSLLDIFGSSGGNPYQGVMDAYGQANQRLSPFSDQGTQQWNNYNNALNQQGSNFDGQKYGNPADWQWKNASLSPTDWMNNIMGSYQQSPQAKIAMNNMTQASNNAASASGMVGSGAFAKELQQNANDISRGDMQQYFNNALSSNAQQMMSAQNYQNQQQNWMNNIWNSAGLGYNATNQMNDNDLNSAAARFQGNQANRNQGQQNLGTLGNLFGNFMGGDTDWGSIAGLASMFL